MCRWFFHARNDNVVSVQDTEKLVRQLRSERLKANAPGTVEDMVKLTIFEEGYKCECDNVLSPESCKWMVDHNCWDIVYNHTPEMWKWLFSN